MANIDDMGFFGKLKVLAVKIDTKLPEFKQMIREPKQNNLGGQSPINELKKIEIDVGEVTKQANIQVAEQADANLSMEQKLDVFNNQVCLIEKKLTSIEKYLNNYGFCGDSQPNTNVEEKIEASEIENIPTSACSSKSPDLGAFGLSSPTVRLLHNTARKPDTQMLARNIFDDQESADFIKGVSSTDSDLNVIIDPMEELLNPQKKEKKYLDETETVDATTTPTANINFVLTETSPMNIQDVTAKKLNFSPDTSNLTNQTTPIRMNFPLERNPVQTSAQNDLGDFDGSSLPPTPKFNVDYNFM